MLSVKQGGIKNHFLSLWYDSTWDWTQTLVYIILVYIKFTSRSLFSRKFQFYIQFYITFVIIKGREVSKFFLKNILLLVYLLLNKKNEAEHLSVLIL